MYEEETPVELRTTRGLTSAINNAMEAKKKSLAAPFSKFLAIANPDSGDDFLLEVRFMFLHFGLCWFELEVSFLKLQLQLSLVSR